MFRDRILSRSLFARVRYDTMVEAKKKLFSPTKATFEIRKGGANATNQILVGCLTDIDF